ncbi:hypothetical protein TrCOL_g6700 [Triparma columacea]|uniref:Coenzyme Q-binding protein COQ10 START domain-containing protein n=1 Tax=Triparma columacea TaxID=722753 RepID=A0A9W7FVX4_9STRA|nr:hypothetical protein TrCOL_g6700 [Triparma columacea]
MNLFLLLVYIPFVLSASSSISHPHTGVVTPFKPGKPDVKLGKKAESLLASGSPYKTQLMSGARGRGLVVQDIAAPSTVVWSRILDFDHYTEMVPRTVISENYGVKGGRDREIKTRMKLSAMVTQIEFFIRHMYYPSKNSLVWTLDYTRKSDIDDSCGFWYVIPHPTKPNWSRVYYSVEVSMFDWVPKVVIDILSKKALTEATGWVKKQSEVRL